MALLNTIRKGFWAIGEIGITPEVRPEEAKHIRLLNMGFLLFVVINLAYSFQGLTDERTPNIIPVIQICAVVLCMLVYGFNRLGRYNTARVYGMALFYATALILYLLSGKDVVDHYFFFIGIAYAFLIFPRKQRRWMILTIIFGFICYVTTLFLYEYVEPASQVDPSTLDFQNQVLLYVVFVLVIVLMMFGRRFMDKTEDSLAEEREKLAEVSALLKKMFGRYLSTEVMTSLIENPSALELGGEKRRVTIMMTDLRGFTALSERLQPEQVVQMLNAYFEVMVEVVLKFQGTINEIIGDALLVIFGAPQEMPDRTQRAIACAIAMQNAMAEVNEQNRAQGLPELEMGIGLNETEVIVGNIGSSKRSKYTVVGSGVNMTSRIESYSVGGQVLISESVRHEAGEVLRIDAQREVLPKGAETPLKIYEVGGIAGQYNLALEGRDPGLVTLARPIPLRYTVLEGKDVGKKGLEGSVVRLSRKCAEIILDRPLEMLTNLKMNLGDVDESLSARDFYGKVIERSKKNEQPHVVRFTSVPSEVDAYFQSHRQHAAQPTTRERT
jgi:class 3 adenylate cyclase